MTEKEENTERERGIVITGSLGRHHSSILTALLLHDVFAHHSVGVSTPKVAEVVLSPGYSIISPDMDSLHMQHILEHRGDLPLVIIHEVPPVRLEKKHVFEQMLADDLNKQMKELITSALCLFDDSEDHFRKEQQKLRMRHYRGKMNSPKK